MTETPEPDWPDTVLRGGHRIEVDKPDISISSLRGNEFDAGHVKEQSKISYTLSEYWNGRQLMGTHPRGSGRQTSGLLPEPPPADAILRKKA